MGKSSIERPWRPTRAQLLAAKDKLVPDVAKPGLTLLLVGINPGLYTAAIGHHFGRPGNRFWPALHRAGVTPRELSPFEEGELLSLGIGVTNVVPRATATADELTRDEIVAGGKALDRKVRRLAPRAVAVLGIGTYRTAYARPKAALGPQPETVGGRPVWVLPNPSGLNAHFSLDALAAQVRAMWAWAKEVHRGGAEGREGNLATDGHG